MGCRQSEADTFCSVRIFTCLENKHLWSFLLSKIQRVKWVAGFSWGSLYFYYFRSIRMANSRSLELYCKHPAINIFKYIKMCSRTNYFVPLWGKMKNTAAISPGAACTYTLRPQSCPSASTIVAGKNKCEKKKHFVGKKKSVVSDVSLYYLGNNTYKGKPEKLLLCSEQRGEMSKGKDSW